MQCVFLYGVAHVPNKHSQLLIMSALLVRRRCRQVNPEHVVVNLRDGSYFSSYMTWLIFLNLYLNSIGGRGRLLSVRPLLEPDVRRDVVPVLVDRPPDDGHLLGRVHVRPRGAPEPHRLHDAELAEHLHHLRAV